MAADNERISVIIIRHGSMSGIQAKHFLTIVDHSFAVGYEDHGLAVSTENILKQPPFRIGIESARSLIEQHYAAVAQQGTGYGYALGLSLA